jgi:ankyrin repeat protein
MLDLDNGQYIKYNITKYCILQDGATPLFKACHKGHLEVAEELLKHGSSVGLLKV